MTLYRDAILDDRPFVVGTWSSSYKSAHAAGMIASEDWATIMHSQIEKLIDRPGTRTIVAYDRVSRGQDFLYGFVSGDPTLVVPVVFYLYVKGPFRSQEDADGKRNGPRHARGLFAALGIDPAKSFRYACRTAILSRLADKIPRARFDPGAARYTTHEEPSQ